MLDWFDVGVTHKERTFCSQAARIAGVISGGSFNLSSAMAGDKVAQSANRIVRVDVIGGPFKNVCWDYF
jgi:predicted nucleic acid-binding Zn finger protein